MNKPILTDAALRQAASQGSWAFLCAVAAPIVEAIDQAADSADVLKDFSADQITLWGYMTLHDEVMDGGFVQLIHNGYGPFFFQNPFAKAVNLWGLKALRNLIYDARRLYEQYGAEIARDCSDEEFMALFEQYPQFDDLDDAFVEDEEAFTDAVAHYVDAHLDDFVTITND